MIYLAYVGVGLAAGVLSGLFGVGGGLVIVPCLVFLFGYAQHVASATSLVALLLPVGFLGVMEYYKDGRLAPENIKYGLVIACGMFFGAYVGVRIAGGMSELSLRRGFAIFMVLVAFKMWFSK